MESKKRTLQTMSPLKIGNVEMQNPLVLAPMAGVTDLPFRVLCKEQGAGLICMEMVSAKAILYKNKNTEDLMTIHPGEHPVSLQLFGSDPEILAQIRSKPPAAGSPPGALLPEPADESPLFSDDGSYRLQDLLLPVPRSDLSFSSSLSSFFRFSSSRFLPSSAACFVILV